MEETLSDAQVSSATFVKMLKYLREDARCDVAVVEALRQASKRGGADAATRQRIFSAIDSNALLDAPRSRRVHGVPTFTKSSRGASGTSVTSKGLWALS